MIILIELEDRTFRHFRFRKFVVRFHLFAGFIGIGFGFFVARIRQLNTEGVMVN